MPVHSCWSSKLTAALQVRNFKERQISYLLLLRLLVERYSGRCSPLKCPIFQLSSLGRWWKWFQRSETRSKNILLAVACVSAVNRANRPYRPELNSSAGQMRFPLILDRWARLQTQSPEVYIQSWRGCRQGNTVGEINPNTKIKQSF